MGVAEKLAIKALAACVRAKRKRISADLQKSGDIGETAQKFLAKRRQSTFFTKKLTVEHVYETLESWLKRLVQAQWTRKWRFWLGF